MIRKLRFILVVACFLPAVFSWSQKSLVKAQRQFELKAFPLAIENARKALEDNPDCVDCHYLIAESFRMMNENVDAAIWYGKLEKFDELPEDFSFNYGLLLKRMGEYEEAKKYFSEYAEIDPLVAAQFVKSCDFAIENLSAESPFEVNLYGASSASTDFGPTIFKDKLIFCSFRNDFKRDLSVQNTSLIQDDKCQLFKSGMGFTGELNNTDFLLSDEEESYDLGPVHYAAEAPVCALTRNNFRNGEKQVFSNDLELSLYIAKVRDDGSFESKYPFPFNEVGYATGFGTLNPTGKILYFASNRPGGFGGFDIYASYFKDGAWTYPDNLGPVINTPGNEITPYFDGETLYFSSDYHIGLGGYDVFESFVDYGKWVQPVNMGNGINSPEDDYYFIKHPFMNSYYLTSNRLGGRGAHDIYLVHKAPEEPQLAMNMDAPEAVDLENDVSEEGDWSDEAAFVNYTEEEITVPKADVNKIVPEKVPIEESIISDQESIVGSETTEDPLTEDKIEDKSEAENVAVDENEFDELFPPKALDISEHTVADVSLVGAKRFALGEVITRDHENVYFIQLAALFHSKADMSHFLNLTVYGSLYKVHQTNATKIKLGYFRHESQAKEVLNKVKTLGYNDAFVTYEEMDPSRVELVTVSDDMNTHNSNRGYVTDYTTGVNYKVRLASYSDPIWFDVEKVKDLGIIEQWTKADWTIFILSGYTTLEEAQLAKQRAINRGFTDAEIVIDRNGLLEKM